MVEKKKVWIAVAIQPFDHRAVGAIRHAGAEKPSLALQFIVCVALAAEKVGYGSIMAVWSHLGVPAVWTVNLATDLVHKRLPDVAGLGVRSYPLPAAVGEPPARTAQVALVVFHRPAQLAPDTRAAANTGRGSEVSVMRCGRIYASVSLVAAQRII